MIKRAIVTGATGKIGKAVARGIASLPDHHVVIIGRNRERCEQTVTELRRETGNLNIEYDLCDLSRKPMIDALYASTVGAWPSGARLDILINNAAVTPKTRMETPEGLELQWATNVMGYYWMINAFRPMLSGGSRIVCVASYYSGGLDLSDPMFITRPYDNNSAYRASKQADRMLVRGFMDILDEDIMINACQPGDVNSVLSNNLGFGGSESPEEGAITPLWLATGREQRKVRGAYFEHNREVHCPYMSNAEQVQELFHICEKMS